MDKKLAYGTYGSLFGIGHMKQKLDKNPDLKDAGKDAVKQTLSGGKKILKKAPKAFVKASQSAKEWT